MHILQVCVLYRFGVRIQGLEGERGMHAVSWF